MMDALKYLKTLRRMCNGECRECEYEKRSGFDPCTVWQYDHPEEAVAIAEQWAAEHPVKTRQSVFLEMFPNAPIFPDTGIVKMSPCEVDAVLRGNCPGVGCCLECRKKFWLTEVEDA
nr:MAG TPA: hypothetical protein [Caudoviricetes sp.]